MPSPCCVPGCKSNYKSSLRAGEASISVFGFPKDEHLKMKWLKAIPRDKWAPTQYSVVCAKHFDPNDIICEDNYLLPDGTLTKIKIKARLVCSAVPQIFPNLPADLTKTVPLPKKSPDERNSEQQKCNELSNEAFEQLDYITNFQDLISNYSQKIVISDLWNVKIVGDTKLYFYTLNLNDPCITIINQISIDSDLHVKVFLKNNELSQNNLKWILPFELKLSRWSQLENLLTRYVL
ncbi:THAP domain-containing protein 1-like [Anthonomus grandis grandis]|uniref:THAP domain-containing protein 1-like n=1 Tax=Anthonomus grandis grandis TaxID=2921223 RepID=UPI002166714A|nr:THAP domain-containing protein 1-like [Anthonomus grandis grandis]